VERTVDNVKASQRATRMAIERAPDDFRSWFLASTLAGQMGQTEAAANYAARVRQLAPLLLLRLREFDSETPTGGD